MRSNKGLLFITLSTCIHLLFLFLDLSYYEEGGDTFIKNTLSGIFVGEPAMPPFSFGAHFVLSYFYLQLYRLFPTIMWYDIFTVFYSIIALTLVFLSFYHAFQKKNFVLAIILGLLLYLDNLLMFEITRISLTIAITSSFLLLTNVMQNSTTKRILLQLLLCLSVFLRIESFFLGSFLMLLILVVHPSLIKNLKLLIPSYLIAIILAVLLNVDWTPRDKLYNDLRPFQFAILDFETKINDKFESKGEELTMEVTQLFFLNDPAKINLNFYTKHLAPLDKNPFQIKEFLELTNFNQQAFNNKLKRINLKYLLWWIFVFAYLVYQTINQQPTKKIFFVWVLFSLILCSIFLLMKIENRILLPSSLGLLLILFYAQPRLAFRNTIILASLLFLFLPNPKYEELKNRFETFQNIEIKLSKLENYKIAVLDLHGSVWYGRKPFYKHEISQNLICLDNAFLFMTPEYERHMLGLFGTKITSEIYSILSQRDDVVFVGDLDRGKIINDYFNHVYEFNYKLHILDTLDLHTNLYLID